MDSVLKKIEKSTVDIPYFWKDENFHVILTEPNIKAGSEACH